MQIPAICIEEDGNHCHHTSKQFSCITFTPEDMQVKERLTGPCIIHGILSEVSRIQVDPRSLLSIMPRRVMQHLEIPTYQLSATQTTIYSFNATSTRPMGKIKLRCQIRDLKSEVTCYVIDADTLYNLLLGRPWIYRNSIV